MGGPGQGPPGQGGAFDSEVRDRREGLTPQLTLTVTLTIDPFRSFLCSFLVDSSLTFSH